MQSTAFQPVDHPLAAGLLVAIGNFRANRHLLSRLQCCHQAVYATRQPTAGTIFKQGEIAGGSATKQLPTGRDDWALVSIEEAHERYSVC
jgi:hypothetical protein